MSLIQVHLEVQHNETGSHDVLATLSDGQVGVLTRFQFQSYTEFARLLLEKGFQALDAAVANPPTVIIPVAETKSSSSKTSSNPVKKSSVAPKKQKKAPTGPYVLFQEGKRRSIKMNDDFDLQERCMKNLALEFKELEEASAIAEILAAATNKEVSVMAGKQQAAMLKVMPDGSHLSLSNEDEDEETSDLSPNSDEDEQNLEGIEEDSEQDFEPLKDETEEEAEEDEFSQLLEEDEFSLDES